MKKLVIAALAASLLISIIAPALAASAPIPMPRRMTDPSLNSQFLGMAIRHQAATVKTKTFSGGNDAVWVRADQSDYPAGTELVFPNANHTYSRIIFVLIRR